MLTAPQRLLERVHSVKTIKIPMESKAAIETLTTSQKGVLLEQLFLYAESGKTDTTDTGVLLVVAPLFDGIDKAKKQAKVNAENGRKGGQTKRKSKTTEIPKTVVTIPQRRAYRKNRFQNFEQHNYDWEKLAELNLQEELKVQ